jgi:protein phosphatase
MERPAHDPSPRVVDRRLIVPDRGLVVLIGPSGSGKSTFAAAHFRPSEILSSDAFRAIVADDEADQRATPAAFDVLHRVAGHRLRAGRLSVIDATNLGRSDRRALLALAAAAHRSSVAIVFNLPEELCQARNRARAGRSVGADVVTRQAGQLRRLIDAEVDLVAEGFAAAYRLSSPEDVELAVVAREPMARPGPLAPAMGSVPGAAARLTRARRSAPAAGSVSEARVDGRRGRRA